MKHYFLGCCFLLLSACTVFAGQTTDSEKPRPNIVIIVVDDMGFSDPGCFGGEIATPNLDSLAQNGLRFTQFYNTARCWSTRSAIVTGYYPQQIRMDPIQNGKSLPAWTQLLPHYLKPLGYHSYHSGKWHVTLAPKPVAEGGFDRSYTLHDHDRNFNPNNHWVDDEPIAAIEPHSYTQDGLKFSTLNTQSLATQDDCEEAKYARLDDKSSPKPASAYYTTTAITDYTLQHLKDHAREHADSPFFVYTAYTVPHFPLQALPEDIAKYKETYLKGWDKIREERHARLLQSGIVNCELSQREDRCGTPYPSEGWSGDLGPGEVFYPVDWDSLTEEQKEFQANKMAIHAAMIDRVDQEVGRIVQQLREMNAFEDTLLLFFSDNGASAEILIRGDRHDSTAEPGSAGSYLCLGPGWSTASNTPFRRHKIWNHEGGISTPLIVHWPNGIAGKNILRNDVGHVVDIVPTILDLLGIERATTLHDVAVPPFPGISLATAMTDPTTAPPVPRDYVYFQHSGNGALRIGDWKCLYTKTGEPASVPPVEKNRGLDGWSLYNLAKDRCEQVDLAREHPEKLAEFVKKWRELTRVYQREE
ncbi:MAG: arylsulfatase [Thermoguttaceae bacterium]